MTPCHGAAERRLGLEVNALDVRGRVVLTHPHLAVEIREIRIHDPEVAEGCLDIAV